MDKKKQMPFNLNNFLLALSFAFDFRKRDLENTTLGHYKRVAFIALHLGIKHNLEPKQLADLCSLSLCYDFKKDDLEQLPFINLDETLNNPLFLEIVSFASFLDKEFSLGIDNIENRIKAKEYIKENKNELLDISSQVGFFLDLLSENEIFMFIYASLHDFTTILDFEEILKITTVFHKIINPDSNLLLLCERITNEYDFEHKDKQTFLIANSLQNIGKLTIPSKILNKKEPLTLNEYEIIKAYPYYSKKILNNIMGFNDIAVLSSKVQERVDGNGYPLGLSAKDLSLKDRLMNTLSVYNALRENRVYRTAFSHKKAIEIMKNEAKEGKLDMSLVEDFDKFFKD
jgi:HD-GYP domain-containing protein (c-di-GMP phosphodiesterase class II)